MQVSHSTEWNKRNRDKINAYKRAYNLRQKQKKLQNQKCLNCEILLMERSKGTRIYCTKCVKEYPKEVRRHKWRRYYYRKKGITKRSKTNTSPHYIISWRTLKST